MIKYLGSKRRLITPIADAVTATGAATAVDLFTGTTRVAQEFKRRGLTVTVNDVATYSETFGHCYITTDAATINVEELDDAIDRLNATPGRAGYFTDTFCEQSRFFQPKNGARVDAIRDTLETDYKGTPLYHILLTSLMVAADRVDSTVGIQMAYLKGWAPRSHNDLHLTRPGLIAGTGVTIRGDAAATAATLPHVDAMYVDPPYNQHRYFTNYHIWETLTRWDNPDHYGVACKRVDSRDPGTKSRFNQKGAMPDALTDVLTRARADVVLVSYNNESWVSVDDMVRILRDAGHDTVRVVPFDMKRYVGAQIGVHNPSGRKVGAVSHLRNVEYLFIAGPDSKVEAAAAAAAAAGPSRVAPPRAA